MLPPPDAFLLPFQSCSCSAHLNMDTAFKMTCLISVEETFSAGLFSVCPLSHSCVSLSPAAGIYCAGASESMQECAKDWVAWTSQTHKTAPQNVPISAAFRDHRSGNGDLLIGKQALCGSNFVTLEVRILKPMHGCLCPLGLKV